MRKLTGYLHTYRWLMLSLVLVGSAMLFTSCGDDDEPQGTVIDYYLEVEEEFRVDGSTDLTDRYFSPITRMKAAIRKVYPTPNVNGNDEAVLAACDKEFEDYNNMYRGDEKHFTCLFHLIRAVKEGSVVKKSERLSTYVYDINSVATDIDN